MDIYSEVLDELTIQYNILINNFSNKTQNRVKLVLARLESKKDILNGSIGNYEILKDLRLSENEL